jgi:heat shock protein HspQ
LLFLWQEEEQSYKTYLDESGITASLKEAEVHERRTKNMFKHKSMEEFLNHLNTSKNWE